MKNKLYVISAAILGLSIILCACSKNEPSMVTTTTNETATTSAVTEAVEQTEGESETVTFIDESGYHVVSIVVQPTEKATMPPAPGTLAPTYKTETMPQNQGTTKAPVTQNNAKPEQVISTTKVQTTTATQPVTVPEISNGLNLLFKTDVVSRGNDATITISGQKGKDYTIEVYRNNTDKLVSDSLKAKATDANGFVSWTFDTDNCDSGYRKVIIKEINGDKYIQTSIKIN